MSFGSLQYQGFVDIDEVIYAGGMGSPAAWDPIQINIEHPASGGVNPGDGQEADENPAGNRNRSDAAAAQGRLASSRLSVLGDGEQSGYDIGSLLSTGLVPKLHAALSFIFG